MFSIGQRRVTLSLSTMVFFVCASLSPASATPRQDDREPAVPANLEVPEGNTVAFHAHAGGVQIYVCKPSATGATQFAWSLKAPKAKLFDAEGNIVGIHYVGPTWQSESGSKVVGAVLQSAAAPDLDAIPWLLLQVKSTKGPGVFDRVTFVQRVHTGGGKAPMTGCDAADVGREVRVPYTAEYFFYRGT
ncbi:MAG: DUF3455 domain-containing protein [Deltaproteobacteria bacterium]|nr:MAG: DUF3455 domain-containing protein [Deltaproteobacteria bacterium]